MYLESQAMMAAMLQLMAEAIPSLSIHDSLIVPSHFQEEATETLASCYYDSCGVWPNICLKKQ
jgi:hypothetical protein